MIEEGGITAQDDKAAKRSQMLYDYIDSSDGYYSNNIHKQFRSKMNIPSA
jgi:phosphoserine aminotransferase